MSDLRLGYSNRQRYALIHEQSSTYAIIREPSNWRDDNKEYNRNDGFDGIVSTISDFVKFTDNGAGFILDIMATYGANTDIIMTKDTQDPVTDDWARTWTGRLDLFTKEEADNEVRVKFNASNLQTVLKARRNEKYELERLDTLKGTALDPIDVRTMALTGRKILLESKLNIAEQDQNDTQFRMQYDSDGDRRTEALVFPLSVNYSSDPRITTPTKNASDNTSSYGGETGFMFYLDNDIQKTLNITINVKFTINKVDVNHVSNPFFQVLLSKYGGGSSFNFLSSEVIYDDPNIGTIGGRVVNETYTAQILLEAGESLSLQWFGGADSFGGFWETGNLDFDLVNQGSTVSISEDSFRDSTQSNCLLPHEVVQRLMQIMTDSDDAFYSDVLGRTDLGYDEDGFASLCGLAHGHWKRGFVQGDELYKPITTSLKEFMESYGAVWGLGLGTEMIGNLERVRIEKKDFFYNRNVTIRLGREVNGVFEYQQVNKLKRKTEEKGYYSEILVGSQKVDKYEEVQGLDEYNAQSTFSTVIDKVENKLSFLSKYRRDATGGELARRKDKDNFPTEDTKYDEHIFMEDMKRSTTDVLVQRSWEDDFQKAPSGIFDPTSATNLRLSQTRMLLRNGWIISSFLQANQNDFTRFTSSEGNSNLSLLAIGETQEYAENGNILNSDFEKPIYLPEEIEFEFPVSDSLLLHIEGSTTILGEEIPNFYGLVEFMNDKGQIERGHLMSLKPNGSGQWKLKKYTNLIS